MDDLSGVREYDVRYKEGPLGQWQAWLTGTLKTEAPFIGTPDAQYYFQVQAIDNVNNENDWVEVGPITVKGVTKYYLHGGTRVAMRQGEGVYYLHGDHLGNTRMKSDRLSRCGTKFLWNAFTAVMLPRWIWITGMKY